MRKIFYRYIAQSFWGPFGFGLAVFCLLLLFGSLFDNLNFFMKSGAGAGTFLPTCSTRRRTSWSK